MCVVLRRGKPTNSSSAKQSSTFCRCSSWGVWQAVFVQDKNCGFGHRFRIEPSNSNIPQHVLTSNASLHPHPMRTWCIRAYEYFTCHGSLVEIRGVVFYNGVWSHYHFDKQNMNCRNTDTFSHNETQTSFLVASVGVMSPCLEFDFTTMCESWHPKSTRRTAWERHENADKLTESRFAWWRHVMCNAPVFFTVFQLYTVTTCIL